MTPAAKAAMTTVPKLFTRPWTMRMPKFITDCCTQVSSENWLISLSSSRRIRRWRAWGQRKAYRARAKISSPRADTHWEKAVAAAAPATLQGMTTTSTRSSTMFSTADTARNTSGVTESPTARSRQAK